MDLTTLAAKLSTIDDLQKRVNELELLMLELLARNPEVADDQTDKPEALTLPEVSECSSLAPILDETREQEMARRIENHVLTRIAGWTWTKPFGSDHLRSPLSASDIAIRLGFDTDEVRQLIKDSGLWRVLQWERLSPPPNHPEVGRCRVIMHVIAPISAALTAAGDGASNA
jgi:hypothetical protein